MDSSDTPNIAQEFAATGSARRVADAARTVTDLAKESVTEKIEQGADKAASSFTTAADTLRRAADDVGGEHAWMSSLLKTGASGLDSAAQTLEGGDVQKSLDSLSGFARKEPALFLGGSFALGFALARVGKTVMEQSAER